MTEGSPINTTTNYPLDIYGATFYYKVADDDMITIYNNNWDEIKGTGKTVQEAVSELLRIAREMPHKYELVDDNLYNWLNKIKNRV